jgi:isopentenyldiphosphate isomerase
MKKANYWCSFAELYKNRIHSNGIFPARVTFQQHLGTCRSECFESGINDREISEIFLIDWRENEQTFQLCEREVDAVQWIAWKDLKHKIEVGDDEFVDHPSEYACLFEHLQKHTFKSLA